MDQEAEPAAKGAAPGAGELARCLREGRLDAARHLVAEQCAAGAEDAVLAELARFGPEHPAALEMLVETLDASGVVRRFAAASLLDPSAIDDVSQDSLISIAQSIGSFDGRSKVTTWVHSIVRRRVADHLRRARETVELEEGHRPAERMSSLIATRLTVRETLAALPELYRVPVELRDLEQLPYATIAERLDRSVGTVKSQISRGRAMLAGRLGPDLDGLEP